MPSTRTAVYSDTFSGALDAGWTSAPGGSWGAVSIGSGVIQATSAATDSSVIRNTGTYGSAQYIKVDIGSFVALTSNTSQLGAVLYGNSGTGACYVLYMNAHSSGSTLRFQLYKVDGALTFTLIAETDVNVPTSYTTGDYIVAETDGAGFFYLKYSVSGSPERLGMAAYDTTYTSGRPGVAFFKVSGDTLTVTSVEMGNVDFTIPAGVPEEIDTYIHFEGSTDNTLMTTASLPTATEGWFYDRFFCSTNPTAQTSGTPAYMKYESNASQAVPHSLAVDGTTYTGSGDSLGMEMPHGANEAIIFQMNGSAGGGCGAPVAIMFDFLWTGANQNSSPRDVIFLRSDPTGNYQGIQIYDDPTQPYLHCHFQPGTGIGNDVNINKDHWYTIRFKHVAGGSNLVVQVYDKQNGYSLVGTSTGAVTGAYAGGASTIMFGLVQYFAGTGQAFRFDNIKINFTGQMPKLPTEVAITPPVYWFYA